MPDYVLRERTLLLYSQCGLSPLDSIYEDAKVLGSLIDLAHSLREKNINLCFIFSSNYEGLHFQKAILSEFFFYSGSYGVQCLIGCLLKLLSVSIDYEQRVIPV